jgi:hypothetical protein
MEATVSENWLKPYHELEEFISRNPEIEIKPDIVIIPEDARPGFYRLFNTVRAAFITGKFQSLLDEATSLSSSWVTLEPAVMASLGITEIRMPQMLGMMLHQPLDALYRPLFDLLFELLKNKIDTKQFEQQSELYLNSTLRHLLREGYKKWVLLSLLSLLAPDSVMAIPLEEMKDSLYDLQFTERTGCVIDELPPLKKATQLTLGREEQQLPFAIASALVQSRRLNSYVSIAVDLAYASRSTPGAGYGREWLKLRPLGQLSMAEREWPDMVAYIGEQPDDIALVADFSHFLRPDIIIECLNQPIQIDHMEKIKRDFDFFKPKLGSFVVSRLAQSEGSTGEPISKNDSCLIPDAIRNIHILNVGLDPTRLEPIISALSNYQFGPI